jgi:CheY-like chemotaxis protein
LPGKAPENQVLDLVPLGLSEHDRAPLAGLRAILEDREEALLVEMVRQRLADPRTRPVLLDPERDRVLIESERRYLRSLASCGPDAAFLAERRRLAVERRRVGLDAARVLQGSGAYFSLLVPLAFDAAGHDELLAERLVATLGRLLLLDVELALQARAEEVVTLAEPARVAGPARSQPKPARQTLPAGRRRILIVDDDPNYLNLMNMIFEDENVVCTVATPEQAVAMGRFYEMDVAILDQVLKSSLTGIDVGRELMRNNPSLKCILVSGYEDEKTEAKASAAGFSRFVPKPFDVETLRRVVEAAIEDPEHSAA